jgi:hypothetical protein
VLIPCLCYYLHVSGTNRLLTDDCEIFKRLMLLLPGQSPQLTSTLSILFDSPCPLLAAPRAELVDAQLWMGTGRSSEFGNLANLESESGDEASPLFAAHYTYPLLPFGWGQHARRRRWAARKSGREAERRSQYRSLTLTWSA